MSHTPHACTSCGQYSGWITCPHCSAFFCFDHCVGHGCPYTGPRPTMQLPTSESDPSYLFHHWCWQRLFVVLHATHTLALTDAGHTCHLTLFSPSLSASHPWYYYQVAGSGQNPFTSPPAETLEDLVQMMHNAHDHARLFFRLLGVFVEQQRADTPHDRVGTPIYEFRPEVVRHRGRVADKPTILIVLKEAL